MHIPDVHGLEHVFENGDGDIDDKDAAARSPAVAVMCTSHFLHGVEFVNVPSMFQ